jgi:hypothetical protein
VFCAFFSYVSFSQIDSINSVNHKLKISNLHLGESSYIVYFQNGVSSPKYNLEVWDRNVQQNSDRTYTINWLRQSSNQFSTYTIKVDKNLKPISEAIVLKNIKDKKQKEIRKYYVFDDNQVYTHRDTIKHNSEDYSIQNTALAFNWELDLETLGLLPLEDCDEFLINFYHPGSKTTAKYYTYKKVREESIEFNTKTFDCWVLKIIHRTNQWSEFWIDKNTKRVLKMKDYFFGKYRHKVLVL